jgi:Sulfotransferase family
VEAQPVTSAIAVTAPLIETLAVTPIRCDSQLAGRGVETPQAGTSHDAYSLTISGWVYATPAAPTHVRVVSEGRILASAAVSFPRPDVAAHLAVADDLAMGFLTDISVLGLPTNFELRLEVELSDERQFAFAAITGRRRPLRSDFHPTIRPVFVTNIGRCGSTLMMDLLRRHPRIVVHDLYPYETRALSYWTHMLKVLSEPANHTRSASPNSYEDDAFWVGRHPHNMRPVVEPRSVRDFLRRDYVDRLAEFCQASTEDFYRSVCEAQAVEEPVYFAEKRNPRATARIASELYPDVREIFLVRDPRDMVCSMISFYEKTRLVSFGRDAGLSDEEFVRRIGDGLRDLVVHMRERREQAIVVRYEDLVGDPPTTLARVLEYLELPASATLQRSIVAEARGSTTNSRRHRTTADDGASIGRWQRDLGEPMKELCASAFGELTEELGYEL